ncbi:metalloendopeptidase [Coemansia sp. RSA 376]|nr:metalloendopeptidase [Coemansia sp. RSA 376]KAJ2345255.1 metalloendopeptidase [Coemansia sp. RSA 2673]
MAFRNYFQRGLFASRNVFSSPRQILRRNIHQRYGYNRQNQPPIWQDRRFWYYAGAAGTTGLVYYEYHIEESPTGRRRFNNVSPAYEKQIGQQAYLQTISEYQRQIIPAGSTQMDRDVRKVAKRLIDATDTENDWEVHVIYAPDEKNAFVLPGGKIFVFSGLLSVTQDDDGLATVLSHEIAHQLANHSAEKLSQANLLGFLYLVASFFVDPNFLQFGRAMSTLLLELPNSRQCEQEADQLGLYLMAKACYDPEQAVSLWQRMKAAELSSPPQFLNTHPSTDSRIENIRALLPQANMKRETANCPTPDLTRSFFNSAF